MRGAADGKSKQLIGDYEAAKKKFDETKAKGDRLVNNLQNRSQWLKFLTALDTCLPPYPGKDGKIHEDPMPCSTDSEKLRKEIMERKQLLITNVDSQQIDDASKWFALVKPWYRSVPGQPGAPPLTDSGGADASSGSTSAGGVAAADGPTGPGFIVQIYGKHFHNAKNQQEVGTQYVISTLLTKLAGKDMHDLGVSYPVLVKPAPTDKEEIVIPGPKRSENSGNPVFGSGNIGPGHGPLAPGPPTLGGLGGGAPDDEKKVNVDRFQFRIQFIWQPKSIGDQVAGATGGTGPRRASSQHGAVAGRLSKSRCGRTYRAATAPAAKR